MLTVTPDLDPVTTLRESELYPRFTDGTPPRVALPMFDVEARGGRTISLDFVDPLGRHQRWWRVMPSRTRFRGCGSESKSETFCAATLSAALR
ncbi:MAG: hypothetical protein M3O32_10670 [Actinomycetota bacterium]|nr:hypothetical protein [Actinomycetota bacterium]